MKNKIKIFIALGISLITTLIFTISTFAYTSNTLSNTLTYDNTDGNYIYFTLNTPIENEYMNNLYLLINVNKNYTGTNYDQTSFLNIYTFNENTSNGQFLSQNKPTRTTDNKFTIITTSNYTNFITKITKISISINRNTSGYITLNDIINIDFVNQNDITTMQYYDYYMQEYQEQISTLTEQYEELQDDYSLLETDYQTLNNNYNNLEDNYDQLEQDYETLQNTNFGANGFYDNVRSITYQDEGATYIELETTTAYKYLSNSTLNLEDLLTANNITNTQQRQTRRQLLEIILDKPINLSNFIYYIQFDGDPKGTPPEDYYIAFFNDNPNITGSSDSSIFYYENTEYINNVGYKLELKGSMFINEIDIYWENLESDRCWPYRMTSSEYNIGYETGKDQGYRTGYNNGINQGTQQGIQQGIQQADSRVNERIVHHI